jgi:predicted small metal-binding protein
VDLAGAFAVLTSERPKDGGERWSRHDGGVNPLRREYAQPMRVIDCDCGKTLQAANDDDLYKAAREHVDEAHPDMQLSDEQVRNLVSERAYEATDS